MEINKDILMHEYDRYNWGRIVYVGSGHNLNTKCILLDLNMQQQFFQPKQTAGISFFFLVNLVILA